MLPQKLEHEYKLIEEYKPGGQSLTFLVQKEDIKYIVKIPKTTLLSKDRRLRLDREIKALELMNGIGVPKLHSYSNDKEIFIVMDFISGLTLNQYVEKNSLDLKTSVSIVIALCEIVEQAHMIGLYHRDLKPDNIIIEESSNLPIIIDFGICWLRDDKSFKTKNGVELGNRFLRLPELSKGTDVTVSASDITFLVGILFYLVTNQHPNILSDENGLKPHRRPYVKDLEVMSNKKLKEIFDKGFTYDISLRYSTAQELKEDLNKILLPTANEQIDFDVLKRLDEIFRDEFYIMKKTNIEAIKNCHQMFLNQYRQSIHKLLVYGGSGPNFNGRNRTVETSMFLVQTGTSKPVVHFHLNSVFDETFDIVISSFGSETFTGQESHTIQETTKMENLYPEIAIMLAEKTMFELEPKIKEN